jgi:hypothetical protein
MCFIRNQCCEADRLDELFSEIRQKATDLAMVGKLSESEAEMLKVQEYAVLGRINDHQNAHKCGSSN